MDPNTPNQDNQNPTAPDSTITPEPTGTDVSGVPQPPVQSEPVAPPAPADLPVPPTPEAPADSTPPAAPVAPAKKSGLPMILIVSLVVVAALAVAAYFAMG